MYEWEVVLYNKWGSGEQTVVARGETIEDAREWVKRNYGVARTSDFKSIKRIDY